MWSSRPPPMRRRTRTCCARAARTSVVPSTSASGRLVGIAHVLAGTRRASSTTCCESVAASTSIERELGPEGRPGLRTRPRRAGDPGHPRRGVDALERPARRAAPAGRPAGGAGRRPAHARRVAEPAPRSISAPVCCAADRPQRERRRPPLRTAFGSRSACRAPLASSAALVGLDSGGGIRTRDLRVMSPTSYQTAPPRGVPSL